MLWNLHCGRRPKDKIEVSLVNSWAGQALAGVVLLPAQPQVCRLTPVPRSAGRETRGASAGCHFAAPKQASLVWLHLIWEFSDLVYQYPEENPA